MSTGAVVALVIALAVLLVAFVAVGGSKAGRSRGYSGMGGETIVRCSPGPLFTTLWVRWASLKIVVPVADSELSEDDRRVAARHHDSKLP